MNNTGIIKWSYLVGAKMLAIIKCELNMDK